MVARTDLVRSPRTLIAFAFAVALALLAGVVIGYLAKPALAVAGPSRYVVVTTGAVGPGAEGCVRAEGHKAC